MLRLTGASGSIRERYNAFLPIAAEGEINRSPSGCSLPAWYTAQWPPFVNFVGPLAYFAFGRK